MKFENIVISELDLSGIKRIVQNKKILWLRTKDRWVKYIPKSPPDLSVGEVPVGGMSVIEMHNHIKDMLMSPKHRVRYHGDTVNIYRKNMPD